MEYIRDEIKDYEDLRSVGSSEACWKLFAFPIAENKPPVLVIVLLQILLGYHLFVFKVLRLHLEDQQHIVFVGGEEANTFKQSRETELTAFFKF